MGFGLDPKDLRPGDVLEGDCFPEPVRVIQIQVWGDLFRLEAVGTRTQGYYDRVLSIQDLGSLRRFRAGISRICSCNRGGVQSRSFHRSFNCRT